MNPLKVSDLKPGDVVRIDVIVDSFTSEGWAWIEPMALDDKALSLGNAERVVRPRPVRKGDEVVHITHGPGAYVASYEGWTVVALRGEYPEAYTDPTAWTHADGSPISWEESE